MRLDSSVLGFLAIFFPLLVRTNDFTLSFRRAIPLLFICICTFTANDLDDVERDRVNHPDRPLPAGHLNPSFAVVLYFSSLQAPLFSPNHSSPPPIPLSSYPLLTLPL